MNSSEMIVGQNGDTKLRDLQLKSLEILLYFADFCGKYDLKFFLCGGSCIGTIRHGGFIPWDDDIDVFMPRKDYEKLEDLWMEYANTEKYSYCRTNKDINYKLAVATIRDNETTFIRDYQMNLDINHGVRMDIIPLDGCPENRVKRYIQLGWGFVFHLFNREAMASSSQKLLGKIGAATLKIIRSKNARYKIWRFAEKQMSKYPIDDENINYITELCVPYRYMKNEYPKELFEKAVYKEFEGYTMPLPIGYDKYLRMAFGDYMELPPEEDRAPKHVAFYINVNEPYEKYEGIYYFADDK